MTLRGQRALGGIRLVYTVDFISTSARWSNLNDLIKLYCFYLVNEKQTGESRHIPGNVMVPSKHSAVLTANNNNKLD